MELKADFEFLNIDRELNNLREAATNLRKASVECRPALCAYIEALKRLTAEMLGRLDAIQRGSRDPGKARHSPSGLRERRKCQGVAPHSQAAGDAVHTKSAPISNGRGHQRIGAAPASRR
jgi:hypothetical protein